LSELVWFDRWQGRTAGNDLLPMLEESPLRSLK
jgi:hypothetical protein